ncbi:Transcription factor [Sarracenia purpurea var. burkii]
MPTQHRITTTKATSNDESSYKIQGKFLKKDDPKIFALMQQAELLSSLAVQVNIESTEQDLENAWKVREEQ